jgi:autotransporter-associated beta strand protein
MGRRAGATATQAQGTATFTFDTGTLEVGTLNLGEVANTTATFGTNSAIMNIGGGNATFGSINMATNAGTTNLVNGTLNFTGGTTTVNGNITKGGGNGTTATLNLNGAAAILDMTSGNLTGLDTITYTDGLLKNLSVVNTGMTLAGTGSRVFDQATGVSGQIQGAITGSGVGLTKQGVGSLTLSGANTYTGGTTVSAGTLLVNTGASIASSASIVNGGLLRVNGTAGSVTVNGGGSLGGSGTVGALTLGSGGLLNPGNSPGTLTAASAIVLGGSTYNWQISALEGTAGTNWDLLSVTGLLNMSGVTSENRWNLVVTADGAFTGWTGTSEYSYVFAQAASVSGFSATEGTDVTSLFNITASGITSLPNASSNPNGDFKVVVGRGAGDLTTLKLMAIPEPSTGSLLGFGLAGLVVTRLLRRRNS